MKIFYCIDMHKHHAKYILNHFNIYLYNIHSCTSGININYNIIYTFTCPCFGIYHIMIYCINMHNIYNMYDMYNMCNMYYMYNLYNMYYMYSIYYTYVYMYICIYANMYYTISISLLESLTPPDARDVETLQPPAGQMDGGPG